MSNAKFHVLVSDSIAAEGVDVLRNSGVCEVDVKVGLKPAELHEIIGNYDALVIRSATKVTAETFGFAKKLKAIGRAGAGVDNVDVPAATTNKTVVMNTPAGNNLSVAELAIGHMFGLLRRIPEASASTKAGKWEKAKLMGQELTGKTVGILGLGGIGKIVAKKANALDTKVIGHDPVVTAEQAKALGVEWVSFDDLLAKADILTIHVPLNGATRGLLNKAAFDKAKKGLMLINASRGGIVVEADLVEALQNGQVGAAAVDVFEAEPTDPQNPLFAFPNVVCTPHLGASTVQAQDNVGVQIAHQIVEFLRDGTIVNAVNKF